MVAIRINLRLADIEIETDRQGVPVAATVDLTPPEARYLAATLAIRADIAHGRMADGPAQSILVEDQG